jgi:hypothetical protein
MKCRLARRKHVDLNHALTAMSDPAISRRDAMVMWRKALRRVDGSTRAILMSATGLRAKHQKGRRSEPTPLETNRQHAYSDTGAPGSELTNGGTASGGLGSAPSACGSSAAPD